MVSIKDVARRAGVSIGTVSNVVNRPSLVSESTRERVRAAIRELGYVRSETARQLRAGQSRVIALLVLDMTNPFFVDVAHGAEREAREQGLGVMFCNSDQDPEEEAAYLSLFAEQRVRGVLITPATEGDAALAVLSGFSRHGIPHVLVDRLVPADRACSVSVDDVTGGSLAAAHLFGLGHRRIGYVTGPLRMAQCADRLRGARAAAAEAGLDEDAVRVEERGALTVAEGRAAAHALLSGAAQAWPTAVFCANDLLALGVLQVMVERGVRVPDDMAIVGYDDIEFAAAAAVPLSSVRQPARLIGRTAARLLIEETDPATAPEHHHQRVVYEPELVVRRSTSG
ncbi:LacI family transcriptional regulator [Mangrovactinospora gilvigrisea]|uniref:LacI family transcriptional regulator n=1 Tax=Mangrovactinospora gilvigrisea TaxID=1428644 RepID=A0A1J7C5R8_9ACTN|nr:LacI family DNA-binding transcriptional regulator [Mangrovactinospora gilvigrisea]OIV36876.1 LacI family transcriptional regulator [Mangrovactinospora gilvigrisea]